MLNETERDGRDRFDRIVDECFSERVTFKVKSAFQSQKDTSSKKRCFGESWQTWVLSWSLFRHWKSLRGLGGPSRDFAEMCLIRRASIKEVRVGKWVIQQRSGNDGEKKMSVSHKGNRPLNVKNLYYPRFLSYQSYQQLAYVCSLDQHRWLWELWLWKDEIILSS